jgi:hypothetical protein
MKFDFSITSKMKLEVKSTFSNERRHHFKHDQLVEGGFDIYVLSYLLREDDQGLSLFELIQYTIPFLANNKNQLLRIYSILKDINESTLKSIKLSQDFLLNQRRFYKAIDIPKFNEKSPEGVMNAEYDSVLENVPSIPTGKFEEILLSSLTNST